MSRYNKAATLIFVSLVVFAGLGLWLRGQGAQRDELDPVAVTVENLTANLDPEQLTFSDLNRMLGVTGKYNPAESPMGASKFVWGRVVEAIFLGNADAVKATSAPISLGVGDDKFPGAVMGVRMGFTAADLNRVAQQYGVVPEFVSYSFHLNLSPSWQIAGALRGGRVVGWLSARRLTD